MTSVFHSSAEDSYGTPEAYLVAAAQVLGGIDLDPASSARWNRRVQAAFIYTEYDDGLSQPWFGSVWLNAPGGKFPKGHKLGGQSKAGLFWAKLLREIKAGNVEHAIVCAFNLNQLQSTQACALGAMLDFPVCFPSARVAYWSATGEAKSPPHASAFVYVPGKKVDRRELFGDVFAKFGKVIGAEIIREG